MKWGADMQTKLFDAQQTRIKPEMKYMQDLSNGQDTAGEGRDTQGRQGNTLKQEVKTDMTQGVTLFKIKQTDHDKIMVTTLDSILIFKRDIHIICIRLLSTDWSVSFVMCLLSSFRLC